MKQKRKNCDSRYHRDNIHKLERGSIVDIGDLLLEAKAQCEHGDCSVGCMTSSIGDQRPPRAVHEGCEAQRQILQPAGI